MLVLVIVLGVLLVGALLLAWIRADRRRRRRRHGERLRSIGGMSVVEKVALGGVEQSILIQTENAQNPVLLAIHGGPGLPIPGVACRGVDWVLAFTTTELLKRFTIVFWDQRGTGKSYSPHIPGSTIHLEQFVSDASELADWLCSRFGQQKIYLSGVSWGTMIGLQLAHRYPQKFHAYFAMSQIVSWAQSDRLAYRWLLEQAEKTGNKKALKELKEVGEPPYMGSVPQWNLLRKWLFSLGGYIYTDGGVRHPGMPYVFKIFLASPDYRLRDIALSFWKGMQLSYSPRILRDFAEVDALSTVKKLELPVVFFHGKHDKAVSAELLQNYYHQLDAPYGKHLYFFESSAHIYREADSREAEQQMIAFANELGARSTAGMEADAGAKAGTETRIGRRA